MKLKLTKRQEDVVKLKAQGFSTKQICDKLFVSIHTVKSHVKHILNKNNLKNGFELVAKYAAKNPNIF